MSEVKYVRPAHRVVFAVLSALDREFLANADTGFVIASAAYGESIPRALGAAVERIRRDKVHRRRCTERLAVTDSKTLTAGLRALSEFG